jgi:hypothetical protein
MTAVVEAPASDRVLTRSTWRAVGQLGLREGRRMVLSPALLVMLAVVILIGGVESVLGSLAVPTTREAYEIIVFFNALYLGLLIYIAAHLVTSSARRTRAEPQLAASTLTERQRSAGLCLGVLFGPGAVGLTLMTVAALLGNRLLATNADGWGPDEPPLAAVFLVQLALTLIGGGLFAVMWATWLRFPGSLPLGLVALVFGTAWLLDGGQGPLYTWQWFAPYISAPSWFDHPWTASGSHHWHAAYLVGLCALAVCGTMLRPREHRVRWVGISAAVVVATGLAGVLQLS